MTIRLLNQRRGRAASPLAAAVGPTNSRMPDFKNQQSLFNNLRFSEDRLPESLFAHCNDSGSSTLRGGGRGTSRPTFASRLKCAP